MKPTFQEDISRVNLTYQFTADDGQLEPLIALQFDKVCNLLGTRDLVRFSPPPWSADRLFVHDPSFPGRIVSYRPEGTKTIRVQQGFDGAGLVLLNEPTGIRVATDGEGYFYVACSDFPRLEEQILALEWPAPTTSLEALDKVYWDDETIRFRKDVEFFFAAWKFFRDREIPYTRAYIFYGPPGNGKTSTIRALAAALGVTPEIFDFSHPNMTDMHFINWMQQCPADDEMEEYDDDGNEIPDTDRRQTLRLVALEDLDRFFPREGEKQTKISLSAILNALDGVHPHRNTIIVATANHPENLDAAVLARPGRFDKKIFFSPPVVENRFRFLQRMFTMDHVSEGTLRFAAERMEGQSYAALAEILKSSGSCAFERGDLQITDVDVDSAVEELLESRRKEAEFISANLRDAEMKEANIKKELGKLGIPTGLTKDFMSTITKAGFLPKKRGKVKRIRNGASSQ